MAIETAATINQLVATNPPNSDPVAEAAAHLRLLKAVIQATFPNITGPVTVTQAELNYSAGLTSRLIDQLYAEIVARQNGDALKADKTGATFTGAVLLPAQGSNPAEAARKDYADALAFSTSLPSQAGNAGKFITTNGTAASWTAIKVGLTRLDVSGTSQTGVAGNDYLAVNAAATTLTLPAPVDGDEIAFTPANGRTDNAIDSGAVTVRGPSATAAGVFLLDLGARMQLKYSSTVAAWVVV